LVLVIIVAGFQWTSDPSIMVSIFDSESRLATRISTAMFGTSISNVAFAVTWIILAKQADSLVPVNAAGEFFPGFIVKLSLSWKKYFSFTPQPKHIDAGDTWMTAAFSLSGQAEDKSCFRCAQSVAMFGFGWLVAKCVRIASCVQMHLKELFVMTHQSAMLKSQGIQTWLVYGILATMVSATTAQNVWTTAQLIQARYQLAAATAGNVVVFAGGYINDAGDVSDNVDLYNTATGEWTTSQLSVARSELAAGSAGTIAIFAGGWIGSALQQLLFKDYVL
jgi:hypothetical protein